MMLHAHLGSMEFSDSSPEDVLTIRNARIIGLYQQGASPSAWEQVGPVEVDDSGRWSGVIAIEGTSTTDGRLIEPDALSWECPIPIVNPDQGCIGVVRRIWRDSGQILAEGVVH